MIYAYAASPNPSWTPAAVEPGSFWYHSSPRAALVFAHAEASERLDDHDAKVCFAALASHGEASLACNEPGVKDLLQRAPKAGARALAQARADFSRGLHLFEVRIDAARGAVVSVDCEIEGVSAFQRYSALGQSKSYLEANLWFSRRGYAALHTRTHVALGATHKSVTVFEVFDHGIVGVHRRWAVQREVSVECAYANVRLPDHEL